MERKVKKEDMLENEVEIVEQAKKDDQAFTVLYDFYFPKIYGYIFKRVGSFDIAEDLVSTTFLKVFTNLSNYKYKGYSFNAWIYKVATNNLIDYYRKSNKKREVNIDEIKELKDEGGNLPEKLVQRSEDKKMVQEILKELPEKYQKVLYLKFFAEKDNTKIAEILKANENNVRVLIFRALKSFKEAYKNYEKK